MRKLRTLIYAEAMLFVHNDKPEPLKLGRVGNKRVSSRYNVEFAAFYLLIDYSAFFFRDRTRKAANLYTVRLQKVAKRLIMLTCEDFCRSHKSSLTAAAIGK